MAVFLPALVEASPPERSDAPAFLGEKLVFAMTILGIAGGELTLSAETAEWGGKPAYKLELSALSNDFLSKFFLVREYLVSWVDPATFRSIRFEKHAVEGRKVRDEATEFDYEHGIVRVDGESRPLFDATLDTLSSVYYLRTRRSDGTRSRSSCAWFPGRSTRSASTCRPESWCRTPAGEFQTIRVEPKSDGTHLLGKEPRALADRRRAPHSGATQVEAQGGHSGREAQVDRKDDSADDSRESIAPRLRTVPAESC